jgi:putative ABC transport system permease protein
MKLPYALRIVVREPSRYLPALLAVLFSAVLVSIQAGMLLGFLDHATRPSERTAADLWVGARAVPALGFSQAIEENWYSRLASQPEVERVEPYLFGWCVWQSPGGGIEQCYVIGTELHDDAIGCLRDLTAAQRTMLGQVGAVAVYEPDAKLLGMSDGVGSVGQIGGQRVEVVAVLHGPRMLLMPGLICSLRTARRLLVGLRAGEVTYLIARCRDPRLADTVACRLRAAHPEMGVLTRKELAAETRNYWLTKTRAGIVLAASALLGLLIGVVITTQTFYSVTAAAWRELAVLRALGIPRWRITAMLLWQVLGVALAGSLGAVPVTLALVHLGDRFGVPAILPPELGAAVAGLMLLSSALAGLVAARSLRLVEPAALLR